jgi:TPR repeat protein
MRVAAITVAALVVSGCATPGGPAPGRAGGADPGGEAMASPGALRSGWATRCEQGFAVDCRKLGRAHLGGAGLPVDDRLAAALLIKGCEMGEPASCSDLGVLTLLGRGVTQDDAAGSALARRACDAGHALACSNVATLVAEGIDRPAPRPGEGREGPRLVRAFQTACEAGALEGCLNLGTARERGVLAPKDVAGAAGAFQRACDGGLPLACHRLALLAAEAPAATPGTDVAALSRRACRAGIALACGPQEEPGPPGPLTPTPRLVAERASLALGIPGAGGFHPTDLAPRPGGARRSRERSRRLSASQLASLPERLGQRLQADAPADDEAGPDEPVELLVRQRRFQLATCLERERSHPGTTRLAATFLVESSGAPGEQRAVTDPLDGELEACAAEVIRGWSFPMPDGGVSGPYLVQFDYEAAPPGATPRYGTLGALRAALKEPGCPERNLRVPDQVRGVASAVTVRLAVDPAGRPSLVHPLTPAPPPLVAAVEAAVRGCAFTPGVGEDGRPLALWLTLTVRLAGR